MSSPGSASEARDRDGRSDWKRIVLVFWLTSMVEGLGVSQVFSFLAPYLRIVGVPDAEQKAANQVPVHVYSEVVRTPASLDAGAAGSSAYSD